MEIQSLRNILLGRFQSLPDDPIAPAGIGIPILMVEIDGHVGIVGDLEIGNLIIVDIVLVDLLGNDEETHVILLLQHDLHLVHDELQFLTLVHRSVGLHLHLLQDTRRLSNVVLVLLALDDHQNASRVFHLRLRGRYLEENLLGADITNGLDEPGPLRFGGGGQPGHGQLDHLDLRLLGLSSPIHEEDDLFVEAGPLLRLMAEGNLHGGGGTMSLRMRTEVKCSLLTRAFFYFSSRR